MLLKTSERFFARRRRAAWLLPTVALACSGCSQEAPPPILPVHGLVKLNGAPLPNAQVRFIPNIGFGSDFIAVGVTDDAGRYELTCHGEKGACAAEHMVTVSDPDIPPELLSESAQAKLAVYLRSLKNRPIPGNYSTPVQSPLKVTVTEGQSEYNLDLKR